MQVKNTWVWSTQNRIGIVLHGNSSEDTEAWLSEVQNDGEKKYRSETSITKFLRQKWENWNRCTGYESQGIKWYWKGVREENNAVSGTTVMSVQNQHQKPLHPLSHQDKETEVRREKEPSEVGVRLGSPIDSRAKTSWKVFAPNHLVIIGILPNVNSINLNRDASSVINARLHTAGWGTTK